MLLPTLSFALTSSIIDTFINYGTAQEKIKQKEIIKLSNLKSTAQQYTACVYSISKTKKGFDRAFKKTLPTLKTVDERIKIFKTYLVFNSNISKKYQSCAERSLKQFPQDK